MNDSFLVHLSEVELAIINNYRKTMPIGKVHIEALVEAISKESTHSSAEVISIKAERPQ